MNSWPSGYWVPGKNKKKINQRTATDRPEQSVLTKVRCCRTQHLIRMYTSDPHQDVNRHIQFNRKSVEHLLDKYSIKGRSSGKQCLLIKADQLHHLSYRMNFSTTHLDFLLIFAGCFFGLFFFCE